MDTTGNNAEQLSNREYYRQWESAVLCKIPGVKELLTVQGNQRASLETKYPDASFALKILSNPFLPHRELGAIQMEAYSSILKGEPISDVHYKYDRQLAAYFNRHDWD